MTRSISPDKALELLKDGNTRFATGAMTHPYADIDRCKEIASSQQPYATILTCSDSRVVPEIIFDCGLGDIFVIRVAGNILDDAALGSIQYAVCYLNCPLVAVLAHDSCGAITAALSPAGIPGTQPLSLRRHIEAVRRNIPESLASTLTHTDALNKAITENAASVAHRLRRDHALSPVVESGATTIVSGRYSFVNGEVTWDY